MSGRAPPGTSESTTIAATHPQPAILKEKSNTNLAPRAAGGTFIGEGPLTRRNPFRPWAWATFDRIDARLNAIALGAWHRDKALNRQRVHRPRRRMQLIPGTNHAHDEPEIPLEHEVIQHVIRIRSNEVRER